MRPDNRQTFRVAVRKRAQQQAVDDAEDGRVSADAQSQCDNGYNSEAGFLQKHSRAVAQILKQCLHKSSRSRCQISDARCQSKSGGKALSLISGIWNLTSDIYSVLRATIGSTFVARRAGTSVASNATPTSDNATPAKVAGSVAHTP